MVIRDVTPDAAASRPLGAAQFITQKCHRRLANSTQICVFGHLQGVIDSAPNDLIGLVMSAARITVLAMFLVRMPFWPSKTESDNQKVLIVHRRHLYGIKFLTVNIYDILKSP